MLGSHWWHAAVVGVVLVVIGIVALDAPGAPALTGAAVSGAVVVTAWFALGRRASVSVPSAVALIVLVVVAAGVGVAFTPSFAFVQLIVFPLVWVLAPSTRTAVAANVAVAVAVAVGFLISTGTGGEAVIAALITESISLGMSLAIGAWITSIATGSEERQRLLDELRSAQEQLAALSRDAGVTSERERLAREIHDTVAQDLAGLVMLAERVRSETDTRARDEQLDALVDGARSALAETRSLVAASAPVAFAQGGLADALDKLGARFTRETGVAVLVSGDVPADLDRDGQVVLLRAAQEALANTRKHAAATRVSVSVESTEDRVGIVVADDGAGFDAEVRGSDGGFGLPGLRDRLALVGGELRVHSTPGSGTTVTAALPRGGTA